MKFPKNRGNLFLVERWTYDNQATVIVGGFSEPETADNYKAACEQELRDKGFGQELDKGEIVFNVAMTTYYD
jgi:hypothetical protein